ncbi:MAG: sensor domain-containing diguanylate cyclase [Firmicutes bacterium]|nr:sensor domain-containing diguanylate cyclase [Bacillota bacterium]
MENNQTENEKMLTDSNMTDSREENLLKRIQTLHDKVQTLQQSNISLLMKVQDLKLKNKSLDHKVFDLFTISQAGKVFTATPDTKRLSLILLSMITERIGVEKCSLLLHDKKRNAFFLSHSIGLDEQKAERIEYKYKEGLFWQLITNGDPITVVDIEGHLRFPNIFRENQLELLESGTWIPMKTKDSVIGVVTLDKTEIGHSDLEYLKDLAAQAAASIETAFLYQEIGESRKELDRRMHNLKILYDIGQALNFIDDLTKLLKLIIDQAIEVVQAGKGSLMLLEAEHLVVRVVRGIDKISEEKILSGEIQPTKIKLGEGIAGRVAKTGKPILVDDASSDGRFLASRNSNVNNILCVPLKVYDEVIGVINISNKKTDKPFGSEDLKIIETLADQAAVAINNARLYEMAVTDGLTKLYIRRHFLQRMNEELRRAMRYGHQLSVMMMDIDHFKKLNDTYGHQAGDLVLIEAAKLFKRTVRGTDVVGRYGGEEFCALLPETSTSGALIIADRLRKELETMVFRYQDIDIKATMSVGVSTFPRDATDPTELMRKADIALYRSKEEGRNRVTVFSEPPAGELAESSGGRRVTGSDQDSNLIEPDQMHEFEPISTIDDEPLNEGTERTRPL